jgi:hypothetical protein
VFTILLATGGPRSLACMGLASGRRRQPSNQRPEDAGSQRSDGTSGRIFSWSSCSNSSRRLAP